MKSLTCFINIGLVALFTLCISTQSIMAQNDIYEVAVENKPLDAIISNLPQTDQVVPLQSGTQNTLNSIFAIDSATAFAVGNGGKIIKTTDEGRSWRSVFSGVDKTLESVFFTDSKTGYAVGNDGIVIKTADAGNTWKKLNSSTNSDLKSVYFINSSIGFAAGTNGTLIKTINSGNAWTKIILETDKWHKDIYFSSTTTGYICGWNGLIFKTTNGGTSWEKLETGVDKILESIHFINESTGFAVGWDGTLVTTTDGGATWEKVELPNRKDLMEICFIDADNVYIVGYDGALFKSTTSGTYWEEVHINNPVDLFTIHTFGDNALLIAGARGRLLKCVDMEKLRIAELKRYWDENEDAYDIYNIALEKYNNRDYKSCISFLDSVQDYFAVKNIYIIELLLKCYLDDGQFANAKKVISSYDSLKPNKSGPFYKRIEDFNKNIERNLADENDWKKTLADSSDVAYDEYIKTHPKGWYKDIAIDEKLWLLVGKSNNPRDFDEYLQKRPKGKYSELARQLSLYYKAKNTGMVQPYEEYFKNFPHGLYKKEVSDSLRTIYIRLGEMAVNQRNPEEAERWFKLYEGNFAATDTVNIIKAKLEAIPILRKEINDEQQRMQIAQRKNQMKNDLKRERRRRNGKIGKTALWGTIMAGGVVGAVVLVPTNLGIGIGTGVVAGIAIIGVVDGFKDIHYYQRHVRNIRRDLKNLNISGGHGGDSF